MLPHLINASVGHDSSLTIVYPGGPTIINIKLSSLPVVTLVWTAEDAIVAAGHDCQPYVFSGSESGWQGEGTLDDSTAPKAEASRSGYGGNSSVGRLKTGAFATFRDADTRGQSSIAGSSPLTDTKLLTIHQNTITDIRAFESRGGQVSRVSTSGVDGNLVVWDVSAVTALASRLGSVSVR